MPSVQQGFLRETPPLPESLGAIRVREADHLDRQMFEYYTPAGSPSQEIRYGGTAPQGTATSDGLWTVQRLTWVYGADLVDHVTDIQTLTNVAWDNRAALPWSA